MTQLKLYRRRSYNLNPGLSKYRRAVNTNISNLVGRERHMRRRCAILSTSKKKKHLINERSRVTRRDTADTAHRYVIVVKTCRATQNRSVSVAANVAISARTHGATSISPIRGRNLKEKGKKAAAHFRRVASRMIGVSLFIPNSPTCYPTN